MIRRQFLAGTVLTASVALGGCLDSGPSCTGGDNWPPSVQVEELELTPGDSEAFEIQVDGITAFSFDSRLYKCGSTNAPVRFGDIDFTPSIDSQADSCPPFYVWDDCTRVTLSVPVHVAPDAETGSYEYGFTVMETIGDRNSQDYEYAIRVSES
ncbi:hypothetical protein [Halorubrum amylolyticum]|uniref:hypothetical protein n=1 Tax=Halorubrum amylolyticum TaxID=2508724 RepID=UPI0010092343|nr:hypothetical protein [Halorubrum amylolyticum]